MNYWDKGSEHFLKALNIQCTVFLHNCKIYTSTSMVTKCVFSISPTSGLFQKEIHFVCTNYFHKTHLSICFGILQSSLASEPSFVCRL